jgi:hypothetical protein
MVAIFKFYMIVALLASLVACQPGEKPPSTFDLLSTAESTITSAANTLNRALQLGTISVDDSEYATAYEGLHEAGAFMDTAWAAYRAGELGAADSQRRLAMDSYLLVRPIIQRLGEVN